jgi:methyl-accepting chemotaxis protein
MFAKRSVKGRLIGGFAVLVTLAFLQGGVSMSYLTSFKERVDQIYTREVVAMSEIARAKGSLYRMRLAGAAVATTVDAQERGELSSKVATARERVSSFAKRYNANAVGPVEQKLAQSFAQQFETFSDQLEHSMRNRAPLSKEGERAFAKTDSLLNDIIDFNDHSAQTRQQYVLADYSQAIAVLGGVIASFLILGWSIAVVITGSVTRPLDVVVRAADRIAAGDLTVKVVAEGQDELTRVLSAMDNMATQLASLVSQVRSCSSAIGDAAARLADASADLAGCTEEQATSLAETASNIEEVTAAAIQNAEYSSQTHGLVIATRDSAANGAVAMDAVSKQMEASHQAAQKIVSISHVISDIAFQTNILSLNAAVEAARAGESGQGFAVVAAEVRNLAMRSAAAARDVKQLINDSLHKVGTSKEIVDQAVGRMSEITVHVKKASDMLGEIAATSREQSAGIEQVQEAVIKMDQITQRNLASSEEAAFAARSLKESAILLEEAVDRFKLEGTESTKVTGFSEPVALRYRDRSFATKRTA